MIRAKIAAVIFVVLRAPDARRTIVVVNTAG
jgi:hypothetical protein